MQTATPSEEGSANPGMHVNVQPSMNLRFQARYAWAALRVALGAIFLWAFMDKLFGLGYTTAAAKSWLSGGSPTRGYLSTSFGPFAGPFKDMAGNPVVDALFMMGLCGVGLAMILGIGIRVAGVAGPLMMLFMYLSHPIFAQTPHGSNPLIDDHIVYAIALIGVALADAGRTWGLRNQWAKIAFVNRHPILS